MVDVDVDASLCQELLEVAIRESDPQGPAHCEKDDLRWELESVNPRNRLLHDENWTAMLQPRSLLRLGVGTNPKLARQGRTQRDRVGRGLLTLHGSDDQIGLPDSSVDITWSDSPNDVSWHP